jgi:hypothetical protein
MAVGGIAIALRSYAADGSAGEVWRRLQISSAVRPQPFTGPSLRSKSFAARPVAKRSVHWPATPRASAAILRDLRSTRPQRTSAIPARGAGNRHTEGVKNPTAGLAPLTMAQRHPGPLGPVARLANGSISAALGQVAKRKHHQASLPARFSPAAKTPAGAWALLGQPG